MGNNLICQKKCCYTQPSLLYEENIVNLNSERKSNLINLYKQEIPSLNIKEIMEGNKVILSTLAAHKTNTGEIKTHEKERKRLKLKIIKSTLNSPKEGQIITILSSGMVGSKRINEDGYTFFGCKRNDAPNENGEKGKVLNDFVIKLDEVENLDSYRGRHFQIRYDTASDNYFIKDLGFGFGVFLKIVEPQIIQDNNLIRIGETFFVCNFVENKQEVEKTALSKKECKLRVKIHSGPSNDETYYFTPSSEIIKIGRSKDCEVQIEEGNISQIQCQIYFQNLQWIINDGFASKSSKNGTWLYLGEEMPIKNKSIYNSQKIYFMAIIK